MFTEADFEKMVCDTLSKNGWTYIPADGLPRSYSDVLVEPMVKNALIRLNPVIAEDPTRADEVIYKLRTLILSAQANNLIASNEAFKKLVFENNSFPFGKNGRSVSIDFFGTMTPERLALNEYVVTNQWVYPKADGGKRLDIVLLVNGFPIAIGELKTPVRDAISWMDGAGDILAYEKSIPQMFVTNVFNFASEGKCYRYSSVNAPLTVWVSGGELRAEVLANYLRHERLPDCTFLPENALYQRTYGTLPEGGVIIQQSHKRSQAARSFAA